MGQINPDSHKALLNQLKNPFDPRLVKWRVASKGKQVAYIDARDVMKRLDEVMGAENYKTHYIAVEGGFICELSLFLKMADGSHQWVTRSDGANNTNIEALKGGISSALKRAANAWGIGRYLYYLNPDKYNRNNIAQWPKWALPNNSIEKWEDVAELEVDEDFGMDDPEEIVTNAISVYEQIQEAKTPEELKAVIKKLDTDTQKVFANQLTNKTEELLGGNTSKDS